ncbi:tRNA lysidine(34) synthetase TilS [Paenibacillus lemnae]|uniref:tRNA(Ile)-lysidine synthase n=1 Tax=Paenibacillus lemnae TaxID=1330551 RepID=A0A848MC92_PAELE|nr:tRNA lysidine(34) synthetase TilS [Paenibacillus lemnae]
MERYELRRMSEYVEQTAVENKLWSPGDTVVVAVSGGPDSVALLHVLHHISSTAAPLQLVCAHVHHGFRQESDQEAEMVRTLAESLSIPFEMARVNVPDFMESSGRGAQDAAREKRYAFLFATAEKYKADAIALAHHADDQAETVLMRLLRGSGPSGLAGMKMERVQKNVKLIRPFLRMNKADLIALCHQCGFIYAVDDSNLQTKYHRNAIRLEVLPFLAKYNPQISSSLIQLAEVSGAEDNYMELAAKDAYASLVRETSRGSAVDAPSFLGLHVALQRRLIKLILNYLSSEREISDFSKIESVRLRIAQEIHSSWSLDLGDGICCIREYDKVLFTSQPPVLRKNYIYELHTPEELDLTLTEIGKVLMLEYGNAREMKGYARILDTECYFDADDLKFPLCIRSRQPGDKMKVMGLNGSKKVKDILIHEKIPPSVRADIPMVCDGTGRILWIPGVRRSVHAAVGQHTTRILRMRLLDAGKA